MGCGLALGWGWRHDFWMSVFGLSYPKSGRTWVRLMVGHIVCGSAGVDLRRALDPPGGLIEWTHGGGEMLRRGNRIAGVRRAIRESAGRPAFLLTRSAEATLESAWFQATLRRRIYVGGLSAFLRDPDFGVRFWRAWHEEWLAALHERRSLVLRYEDVHRDPHTELARLCDFLELSVASGDIRAAVAFGGFGNMRRLEREGFFAEPSMRSRGSGAGGMKTRSGGGRSRLTDRDRGYIRRLTESREREESERA